MSAPAGWYPDPREAFDYRWWDGTQWTERVTEEGVEASSPMPADLHPAAPDPSTAKAAPIGDREGDAESTPPTARGGGASAPKGDATAAAPTPAQVQPRKTLALAIAIALLGLGIFFAVAGGAGSDGEPEDDETDAPFGLVWIDTDGA